MVEEEKNEYDPYKKDQIRSIITSLQDKRITFVMRNAKSLFNFRKRALEKYNKEKLIEEVEIYEVITEDIKKAFLYFGNIYFERNSLYPRNLDRKIFIVDGELKEDKNLFENFNEQNKSFCNLEMILENSFRQRIDNTFKYVDGLINKNLDVFLEKEIDILNQRLSDDLLKNPNIDYIYNIIKKYKENIYFIGKEDNLQDLYTKVSNKKKGLFKNNMKKIAELSIKLIENRDNLCVSKKNYSIIEDNLDKLLYPFISYVDRYINKIYSSEEKNKNSLKKYLEDVLEKIEKINNIFVKIYLYIRLCHLSDIDIDSFGFFGRFCKETLNNDLKLILIDSINFSVNKYFQKKLLDYIESLFKFNQEIKLEKLIKHDYKKITGIVMEEKDLLITMIRLFNIFNDFDENLNEPRKIRNLFSDKIKLQILFYPIEFEDDEFKFNRFDKYNIKEMKIMYNEFKGNINLLIKKDIDIYLYQNENGSVGLKKFNGEKELVKKWLEKRLNKVEQ